MELTVRGEHRAVPPGVELAAYRVVQEALTNTVKHAGGAAAAVTVEYKRQCWACANAWPSTAAPCTPAPGRAAATASRP